MNWKHFQAGPWLDTRARFVAGTPNNSLQRLFPDCKIHRETVFGFTKSYVAIRQRA